MANEAIATVVAVVGKAYARNADGELREIRPGDVLLEGETVVTPDGGQVELSLVDGNPFVINDVAEMTMSRDLVADSAAGADESAVEDESVEALLAALEGEGDISDVLDDTAAGGAAGGGEGSGHSWVRLGRVVESTSEFTGLAALDSAPDAQPVDQQDAILAVDAIDDTAITDEGDSVVIDVQQNDEFLEGSIVTSVTQPGSGTVVINADNTVTYTPNAGFTGEDSFTYTAIAADGSNGDTATVTVTVNGDQTPPPPPTPPVDEPPTLSINEVTVTEGGTGILTVTLSQPSDDVVTVSFASEDGTATVSGGDYNPETGEITFAPGQTTATIQFQTNKDNLEEGAEQFLVNLSNPSGATIADGQGVVTIVDDFTPPTISINNVSVSEGQTAELTLTLSSASDKPVSVDFASADGSATVSGGDYNPASGTITFAPGTTEVTVQFATNTDNLEEATEQFLVNLSNPENATLADNQGVVEITDATTPPQPPQPPQPPEPPAENTPPVAVNDSGETEENTSIVINILGNDSDSDGTLVPGTVLATQPEHGTISLDPVTGQITYTPNQNYSGTDSFTYTVKDDDGASSNTAIVNLIVNEGREIAQFTDNWVNGVEYTTYDASGAVTGTGLTGDQGSPGSFSYDQGERIVFKVGNVIVGDFNADAAAQWTDQGILFIHDIANLALSNTNASQLENTAIFLQALDNDLTDGDLSDGLQTNAVTNAGAAFNSADGGINISEATRAQFSNYWVDGNGRAVAAGTPGAQALDLSVSGKVMIQDALNHVGIEFTRQSEADPDSSDGFQNIFETIAMDHVVDNVDQLAGARDPGSYDGRLEDLINVGDGQVTFFSNQIVDNRIEFDANSLLLNATPQQVANTANMEITGIDVAAEFQSLVDAVVYDEAARAGYIQLKDGVTADQLEGLALDYTVWDWTANIQVTSEVIDLFKSHLSAEVTDVPESTPYNQFTLNSSLTFDTDQQLTVKFTPEGEAFNFAEYGDDFIVPIEYSTDGGATWQVMPQVGNYTYPGYALELPVFGFTLPAGSDSVDVRIPIFNDVFDEDGTPYTGNIVGLDGQAIEYIDMTIEGDRFYTENLQPGIIDDDPSSELPAVEIDFVSVDESVGVAVLTVSLVDAQGNPVILTEDVTVDYQTADLSAIAGSDYESVSGTVTILAGSSAASIEVPIIDDFVIENTEFALVNLTGVSGNAVIGDPQGTIRILDNDSETQFSIDDVTVAEGGLATFTVTRSGNLSAQSITASTSDGTAEAGADYTANQQVIEFAAGQTTATFTVQTSEDVLEEDSETFNVTLSNAQTGDIISTFADDGVGVGTILDDALVTLNLPADAGDGVVSVNEAGLDAGGSAAAENSETISGSFTYTAADTPVDMSIGGVSVVENGVLTANTTITTAIGVLTVTGFDAAAGSLDYSYTLSGPVTDVDGASETDSIAVTVNDEDGDSDSGFININIVDDVPTAADDSVSLASGEYGPVENNVMGNDTQGADGASVVGVVAGTSTDALDDANTLGTSIAGDYGTLTIAADGSYSYTRNPNAPGGVSDRFTYTIKDADGDTDTAVLTVNINDGNVTVDLPADAGSGSASVNEAGLNAGGSSAADDSETTTGNFTYTAVDTPIDMSIGGVSVVENGVLTGNTTITTAIGVLTVTGYDAAAGSLSYSYTLSGPISDVDGAIETDSIEVTVSDIDDDSASGFININIVDDVPTAVDDSATLASGEYGPLVDNVLVNDTQGADGANVVGVVAGTATEALDDANTLGTQIAGVYGTLTLAADGSYSYTRNPNAPGGVSDRFTYTIKDADGDTDTAVLTLNLSDGDVTLDLPAEAGEGTVSVNEAGLDAGGSSAADNSETTTGTFTYTAVDTPVDINIGGVSVVENGVLTGNTIITTAIGVLTVTAYDATSGSLDYSYTLSGAITDVDGAVETDSIAVTVSDEDGDSDSGFININIVDDLPAAVDDEATVAEDAGGVLIDVFDNDVAGADGINDLAADLALASGPTNGSVVYNNDGTFTYTADANFSGDDSFTYTITDGDGDPSTATVRVAVTPVADDPTASLNITGPVTSNITYQQAINVTVGDERGDDNLEGTNDYEYNAGENVVLDLGVQNAGRTISLTLDVEINGSWNHDGNGSNFDDYWELLVDGATQARFYYNDNVNEQNDSTAPVISGQNYVYGAPQTSQNGDITGFEHTTPTIQVTLDENGQATLGFAAATTQTSEIAHITGLAVIETRADFEYEIELSAALADTDGSESLSVALSGIPAPDSASFSFVGLSSNSGATVSYDSANSIWVLNVPSGSTSVSDTLTLNLTELSPGSGVAGFDPDFVQMTATATESDGTMSATVVDGIVEGLAYSTSSGLSGFTNDRGGFQYRSGDTVTFTVGSIVLGVFAADEVVADGKVFLQEIAGTELADLNDDYVENMAVFLQSLDPDADAYNGIVITEQMHEAFSGPGFDLATISEVDLQQALTDAGLTPVSEADAMQHVKDMLTEHAGITEFEEHVSDAPTLLASGGDDVFAFSLDDSGEVGQDTTIIGFGDEGSDAIDLRDLLQGEEAEEADLTSYLNVSSDGTDTVIQVSVNGDFNGSAADVSHVEQSITLAGVDLVSGHDELNSVIQNMLDSGKLNVDQ